MTGAQVRSGATAALLVMLACGGGGGGGGTPPTQPPASLTFSAGASGNNAVHLVQAGGSATQLVLAVQATQVTALYGAAFDVVYPSNLLSLSSTAAGTFLAGVNTSFQVKESTPGRIVIGYSRLGAVGGVSGSGTLATLTFVSRSVAGSGSIGFENHHAFSSSGLEDGSIAWAGGTVSIVP